MKRFLAVAFISLVIVQLCLLPMSVIGGTNCPSVSTLPATNITINAATLNGTVDIPDISGKLSAPNGVVLASLQCVQISDWVFVSFEYGTAPGLYTGVTPEIGMSQSGTFPFQASINGLSPCTTYYAHAKVRTLDRMMNFNPNRDVIQGAGVGLDYKNLQRLIENSLYCPDSYGSEISFQTTGCQIFTGTGTSHGSSVGGPTSPAPPVSLPNIVTQSASLSTKAVTPGTPVTVTADITNKSAVNGNKKVTLYVNGQVETTQGVNVSSGSTSKLTFNVSRSEPGDYTVYVDGVPAGSFKVEMVTGNDAILIFSAGLIALAFMAGMFMLWRRQKRTV